MQFDIVVGAQRSVDAALCRSGVAAKRVQLGQHSHLLSGTLQFTCGCQTGETGTDNHNIVFMYLYTHVRRILLMAVYRSIIHL